MGLTINGESDKILAYNSKRETTTFSHIQNHEPGDIKFKAVDSTKIQNTDLIEITVTYNSKNSQDSMDNYTYTDQIHVGSVTSIEFDVERRWGFVPNGYEDLSAKLVYESDTYYIVFQGDGVEQVLDREFSDPNSYYFRVSIKHSLYVQKTDIKIIGNTLADGDMAINGGITVGGDTTVGGKLQVTGDLQITGNLVIGDF